VGECGGKKKKYWGGNGKDEIWGKTICSSNPKRLKGGAHEDRKGLGKRSRLMPELQRSSLATMGSYYKTFRKRERQRAEKRGRGWSIRREWGWHGEGEVFKRHWI